MHVNIIQLRIYGGLDPMRRNHKRPRSCYVFLISTQLILFRNKVINCNNS